MVAEPAIDVLDMIDHRHELSFGFRAEADVGRYGWPVIAHAQLHLATGEGLTTNVDAYAYAFPATSEKCISTSTFSS